MFLVEIEWIPNGKTSYAPTNTMYQAILKAEEIVHQSKSIPRNVEIFELENDSDWSYNRKLVANVRTMI